VRLTGTTAATKWQHFMPLLDNVSRFDLQATVQFEEDEINLERHYADAMAQEAEHNGRYPGVRLITTYGKGDTVYLGSRISDKYLRIYDKFRESKDDVYEKSHRIEVEFKNKAAKAVATDLYGFADRRAAIVGLLYDYLTVRKLVPCFDKGVGLMGEPKIQRDTDVEKQIGWLLQSVSPTVRRLCAAGYTDVIYSLFDLEKPDKEQREE
jgi:DNA relaxase NicK